MKRFKRQLSDLVRHPMTNGQPMQFTKYWHSAITASLARNSSHGVLQSLESVDIAG